MFLLPNCELCSAHTYAIHAALFIWILIIMIISWNQNQLILVHTANSACQLEFSVFAAKGKEAWGNWAKAVVLICMICWVKLSLLFFYLNVTLLLSFFLPQCITCIDLQTINKLSSQTISQIPLYCLYWSNSCTIFTHKQVFLNCASFTQQTSDPLF